MLENFNLVSISSLYLFIMTCIYSTFKIDGLGYIFVKSLFKASRNVIKILIKTQVFFYLTEKEYFFKSSLTLLNQL